MGQGSYATAMAQNNNMGQILKNTQNFIRQKWTTSSGTDIVSQRSQQLKAKPKQMEIKTSGTVDLFA